MMEATCKGGEGKGKCGENLLEGVIAEGFQDGLNRSSSLLSSPERKQSLNKDCLQRVPKNTITFIAQVIVLYSIIAVSVYHISVQSPNQELWLVLLSSAFGYILTSPGLKYLKQRQVEDTSSLSFLNTDATDVITDPESRKSSSIN